MKKPGSSLGPRHHRLRDQSSEAADLDSPFAVLKTLQERMGGRFVTNPTGKASHTSEGRKSPKQQIGKKRSSVSISKKALKKSLDLNQSDNGQKPIERMPERTGWKQHAEEVEAWLASSAKSMGALAEDYPEKLTTRMETTITQRMRAGTVKPFPPDIETDIVLGIDFGTTSTKIVASFPYEAGTPAYPLPALEGLCMEEHPHLFPSALWVDSRSHFHLAPKPGRHLLPDLKRDLMEGRTACTGGDPNAPIDPQVAVAAFLALHVRHARGWMLEDSEACRPGCTYAWTVHVGFPAAALDNRLSAPFERALAAALLLARGSDAINRRSAADALTRIGDTQSALENEGGAVFPEISAAVAGFAASRRLEPGLYGLIDIGGMTLDCCTFDLRPSEEGIKNPIFVACVAPFGIQNLNLWRRKKKRVGTFVEAIKWPVRNVIHITKARRQPFSPRWESSLPLFATGGWGDGKGVSNSARRYLPLDAQDHRR